jgi:hypothetical protein
MGETTYSQIGQDIFVRNILQEKRCGLFFDIGCGYPKYINNTYLLEKHYDWHGISIDLDSGYRQQWLDHGRTSIILIEDATKTNYQDLMGSLAKDTGSNRIDYLSMDLEPPINTLLALKRIPFDDFRFSVITFEHDSYRKDSGHGEGKYYILNESRALISGYDYGLVYTNMQEDWWIDKKLFPDYEYINHAPIIT